MRLFEQAGLNRAVGIDALRGCLGGTLSIFILLQLSQVSDYVWIMAPFGASCVLLYAVPYSPLAQAKDVILGHVSSACVGLLFLEFFPIRAFTIALAVGISIAVMQCLKCIHPPAGANPLVLLLTYQQVHYGWDFLLFPVLTGAVLLVVIAKILNRWMRRLAI